MKRIFDLAQPYFSGMPHFPTHPPFLFGLTKLHGEVVAASGMSSAADSLAFSGHCGTHIDALGHFSCAGFVCGGVAISEKQSYSSGLATHDAAAIQPLVARGVLLDIARLRNFERLTAEDSITDGDLQRACETQRVEVHRGDVILIRTGWGALFDDARRYVNNVTLPGVNLDGAKWLSGRGAVAAGADTLVLEKMPSPVMEVHVHLLVESGIHIIENLNLEELAAARVYDFQFVGASLKIRGGTGAPVRPLAIVE